MPPSPDLPGPSPDLPGPPPDLPGPVDERAPVVLYTTPWCGFCRSALALLRRRGIVHREIDVTGNPAARQWLAAVTRQSTVPQVFVHGRSIGGFVELLALDQDGTLMPMVDAGR